MSHHVFGVRHHGPGCARSLVQALDRLEPDAILIEGPPDANEVLGLPLLASAEMRTPVAILVYPPEAPHRAVFYPFAEFSPEWQAMSYSASHEERPRVRFMDLPQAQPLLAKPEAPAPEDEVNADGEAESGDELAENASPPTRQRSPSRTTPSRRSGQAAGFSDGELWWEHEIERRKDPTGMFEGLLEAMRALRESRPTPADDEEKQREAFMRQTIRGAIKEGFQKIAVVCGAWHAPVLSELGPAKPDVERLKSLPKTKTVATWIPWTPARLSFRSGYGAGVTAPGWYQHLWTTPHDATLRWTVRAARTLREEDLPSSTASVIEAVRLAETLAALRGLGSPGLGEINESVQAVLCGGAAAPLALVRDRIEIGVGLGQVPKDAPAVPLRRELEAEEKRLRLKRTDEIKPLDLDLRETTDRARSRLLHRLRLLGVGWGTPRVDDRQQVGHVPRAVGPPEWQPELEVSLVGEASRWGNTIDGPRPRADQRRPGPPSSTTSRRSASCSIRPSSPSWQVRSTPCWRGCKNAPRSRRTCAA